MKIINRKEARALGLKRYFTGKPCKRGHVCERLVSASHCWTCSKIRKSEWRKNNPEKAHQMSVRNSREWRQKHPEHMREYRRAKTRKLYRAYQALRELGIEV